jgi:hypothetical protein
VKRVTKFETTDGQMFDSEREARGHELKLEAKAAIEALAEPAIKTGRIDSFLTLVLNDPTAYRDILTSLIRKQGTKAAA